MSLSSPSVVRYILAMSCEDSRMSLPWRWRRYVPPKRLFLLEPHGTKSQKTCVTANYIVHIAWNATMTCRKRNCYSLFGGGIPVFACENGHLRSFPQVLRPVIQEFWTFHMGNTLNDSVMFMRSIAPVWCCPLHKATKTISFWWS
jgi:hypothetical protein